MERSRTCNNLKQPTITNRNMKRITGEKLKDSWDIEGKYSGAEPDLLVGFSWPPRCYTCSFCKREFRSAQALGGHMNVHRRDKARLRQSPPKDDNGQFSLLNLDLDPYNTSNLNPKHSLWSSSPPCSPLTNFPCLTSMLPPFLPTMSPSLPATSLNKGGKALALADTISPLSGDLLKTIKPFSRAENFGAVVHRNGSEVLKKAKIVGLDLKIGLNSLPKEGLDLELRLGYT